MIKIINKTLVWSTIKDIDDVFTRKDVIYYFYWFKLKKIEVEQEINLEFTNKLFEKVVVEIINELNKILK